MGNTQSILPHSLIHPSYMHPLKTQVSTITYISVVVPFYYLLNYLWFFFCKYINKSHNTTYGVTNGGVLAEITLCCIMEVKYRIINNGIKKLGLT